MALLHRVMTSQVMELIIPVASLLLVGRYQVVFRFCELYQSWALTKKSQQAKDITKQENFETHSELPLKITR